MLKELKETSEGGRYGTVYIATGHYEFTGMRCNMRGFSSAGDFCESWHCQKIYQYLVGVTVYMYDLSVEIGRGFWVLETTAECYSTGVCEDFRSNNDKNVC